MGRFTAIVLGLLVVTLEPAVAQTSSTSPRLSVTILLDLSYSMRLPLSLNKDDRGSPSRLDQARRLLHSVIHHGAPATQWALITFGGTAEAPDDSAPHLRSALSADGGAVETEVARLSAQGLSPLSDAILYAVRYSDGAARTARRVLLVVSDGAGTMPSLFEMPSPRSLRGFSTRIVFAGLAAPGSSRQVDRLRGWLRRAGGRYVNAGDPSAVEAAIRTAASSPVRPSETPGAPASARVATAAPGGMVAATLRRPGARRAAIIILLLPLLAVGWYFIRRRGSGGSASASRVPVLRFRCEAHEVIADHEITELPAELSNGESAGPTAPVVELRGGQASLISARPVLVNGVAVRRAGLTEGDRIRVGAAVWSYRGVELRQVERPVAPQMPFWPAATAGVAAAALLIVGFGPVRVGGVPDGITAAAGAGSAGRVADASAGRPAPGAAANDRENPGFVALAGGLGPVPPRTSTEMIDPGRRVRFFKADVLFIHTHPDDDSIDFGGLMALESRAGKRIVTVVFTDGGAGLDQFPNRRVGGVYPPHALRGRALGAVRVREAQAALSILGAKEYVRLGVANNPYESITEILPIAEVLKRWGGEARLVRELAGLIRGFRPEIVVSPDERHRGVFKHFEHEAVGYLTDRALGYLAARGENFVRAHLVAVDPMLRGSYPDAFGVPVGAVAPESGLTYRAIQVAALKEHATQRDASVIGVEVLANFEDEYYAARSWHYSEPPRAYFARLTG